jgi:putative membrane protein (TIGR04086 family)
VSSSDLEARATVRWPAVIRGALLGLALIIPVTIVGALLDRAMNDFQNSGWRVLLALLIALAFAPAGAYAARLARAAPLTNGALAGLVWLPLRFLIWLTRNDDQGLVSGRNPVFRPGQLFGFLVISTALGMLGGFLASRRRAHDDSPGGSPS